MLRPIPPGTGLTRRRRPVSSNTRGGGKRSSASSLRRTVRAKPRPSCAVCSRSICLREHLLKHQEAGQGAAGDGGDQAPQQKPSPGQPSHSAGAGRPIWNEHVAVTPDGLEISGAAGIRLDQSPHPRHLHIHAAGVCAAFGAPRQFYQTLSGKRPMWVLHKGREQTEILRR